MPTAACFRRIAIAGCAALLSRGAASLRTLPVGADEAGAYQEPTPDEFVRLFDQVEFAKQPYADQMAHEGFLGMTDEQKVWMSHYWEGLLQQAVEPVRRARAPHAAALLSAVEAVPELSEAVLFSAEDWDRRFLPKLHAALALIPAEATPDEAGLATLLRRLETHFPKDMSNPRKDFYLGMTDQSVFRLASAKAEVSVPLGDIFFMHSLNTPESRATSDTRSEGFAAFFRRMYDLGIAQKPWSFDAALREHADDATLAALSSITPFMSFELRADEAYGPCFVVIEGNGRIAAMNVALDSVRAEHPDFVAPSLALQNYEFGGSDLARRNRNFFLELDFRNQFPKVRIPGWQPKVHNSLREADDALLELVRSRPRYFGMVPAPERQGAGV